MLPSFFLFFFIVAHVCALLLLFFQLCLFVCSVYIFVFFCFLLFFTHISLKYLIGMETQRDRQTEADRERAICEGGNWGVGREWERGRGGGGGGGGGETEREREKGRERERETRERQTDNRQTQGHHYDAILISKRNFLKEGLESSLL